MSNSSHRTSITGPLTEVILICLFLSGISVPGLMLLFGVGNKTATDENRVLEPLPALISRNFYSDEFRRSWQEYVNDHFGFRGAMVEWNLRLYVRFFHSVPVRGVVSATLLDGRTTEDDPPDSSHAPDWEGLPRENVFIDQEAIVGRDGWLFYARDAIINDFRATQPFQIAQLEEMARRTTTTEEWLAERGVVFAIIAAPNKQSIYGEFIPDIYDRVGPLTRLDQVQRYFLQHTDLSIVDPRGDLSEAKSWSRLYEKTGTHWNDCGALIAHQSLMRRLQTFFPLLHPPSRGEFTVVRESTAGMELARMLAMGDTLTEERIHLVPYRPRRAVAGTFAFVDPNPSPGRAVVVREVPGSEGPRLLMFRDSFASHLIPFISEQFSRSVYVWSYRVAPEIVESEQPDVVVLEFAERLLYRALSEQGGLESRESPSDLASAAGQQAADGK